MENIKDFSSTIAAAMQNPEQMLQINKMLNKANFELNRSENKSANICRIAEKEIWKNLGEVAGFEIYSEYEISTFGRVKSLKFGKEKILKPAKGKDDYFRVELTVNGNRKKFLLHRIIASAFVKNDDPEVKTQVNHINHQPSDCFYKNLEWVSPKENQRAFYDYDDEKVAKKSRKMSEANKGKKRSEETKLKMSQNHADVSGENHPNFGKKHSDETRKKMSDVKSGENNPNFGKFGAAHPNFGKKYKKKAKSL